MNFSNEIWKAGPAPLLHALSRAEAPRGLKRLLRNSKTGSLAVAALCAAVDNKRPTQSRARQQAGAQDFFRSLLKPALRSMQVAILVCCIAVAQDPPPLLTAADVTAAIQAAAASVNVSTLAIAVTDRQGNALGVFAEPNTPATSIGNFGTPVSTTELAVALARTAAFFSNSQAPLSSRTVRFISATHFPAGILYTPSGPLYGIENTNRGCSLNANFLPGQAVPPATLTDGFTPGLGPITGKADLYDSDQNAVNPGGVPLYKNGVLVGGIGVAGDAADIAEFAAFSGAYGAGFGAAPAPPGVVIINGIALPFVNQTTVPEGASPGAANGNFVIGPIDSPGPAPEGDLVAAQPGPLGGLSQVEVQGIIDAAVAAANQTRAVIRLPLGSTARMVIAVSDVDGTILALHRMPDATVFSIDVAVAKSRNVIWFTGNTQDLPGIHVNTAVTNRTVGFGAQPFFAPGVDYTKPGPFFVLYMNDAANPCTQGSQPANPNQNGIVFFPGSMPLYKNGVLVGGLGVSGDGVDQDDYVTFQAASQFEPPAGIRADQIIIRATRLPFFSFPRNPTVR